MRMNTGMNMNGGSSISSTTTMSLPNDQMTFYWGQATDILFPGWPGESAAMYTVALISIFLISIFIEWLSHARVIKPYFNDVVAGMIQTFMYAARTGLAYLVMLAVMSFNIGVFIVAIAGYATGFMIFRSRAFRKSGEVVGVLEDYDGKSADLPPFTC